MKHVFFPFMCSQKHGPGEQILHIVKNVPCDIEDMRRAEQTLPPSDGNFFPPFFRYID